MRHALERTFRNAGNRIRVIAQWIGRDTDKRMSKGIERGLTSKEGHRETRLDAQAIHPYDGLHEVRK